MTLASFLRWAPPSAQLSPAAREARVALLQALADPREPSMLELLSAQPMPSAEPRMPVLAEVLR